MRKLICELVMGLAFSATAFAQYAGAVPQCDSLPALHRHLAGYTIQQFRQTLQATRSDHSMEEVAGIDKNDQCFYPVPRIGDSLNLALPEGRGL